MLITYQLLQLYYIRKGPCVVDMTNVYLFLLEDRDCFLLCEYEDVVDTGGNGRRGVTNSGGSLPLLVFARSLAS